MPESTHFRRSRGTGPPKVALAGFGKLQAWAEHRQDLGEFSPALSKLRGIIYGDGILKLDKAWNDLAEKQPGALCGYDHWLVGVLPGSVVLGRAVDSADLAGRKDNAFIAFAEITGCSLGTALRHLPSRLDAFTRRCVQLPDREGVRAAFTSEKALLESLLAGQASGPEPLKPSVEERAAFLAAPGFDAEGLALARLLHKVELSWAAFAALRGGKAPSNWQTGTALRLPSSGGKMEASVLLWEEFITSRVHPQAPRFYIAPAAHGWLDVVVGELEGGHFRGMRLQTGQGGIIPETEVPYTVSPELQAKAKVMMSSWLAGELLPSTEVRPPVPTHVHSPATTAAKHVGPTVSTPDVSKSAKPSSGKWGFWALPVLAVIMAGVFIFLRPNDPKPIAAKSSGIKSSTASVSVPLPQSPAKISTPPTPAAVQSQPVASVEQPVLSAPAIQPAGGMHRDLARVTLTTTNPGAKIYYTLDGAEPTEAATLYRGPFSFGTTTLVKARTLQPGFKPSPTVSSLFTIAPTPALAPPTVTPASGTYRDSVHVKLAAQDPAAKIFYTIDGSEPIETSAAYQNTLVLRESKLVKARSFRDGFNPSPTISNLFIVTPTPVLVSPSISPTGGIYHDSVRVMLAQSQPDAMTYYTMDGTEPTIAANLYRDPLLLTTTALVKARCFRDGFNPSLVVSNLYVVAPMPTLAAPTISPAGGTYRDKVQVTLGGAQPEGNIYYTVDGTEPTSAAHLYRSSFSLTATTLVKARAFRDGFKSSSTVSNLFSVTPAPFTPPATQAVSVAKAPKPAADQEKAGGTSLQRELEAFKVWFQLQKNNGTPAIVNPAGYNEMGIIPGSVAKPLPTTFDRITRKQWEQKADDLKKRLETGGSLTKKEIDHDFQNLRDKIRGAGSPF